MDDERKRRVLVDLLGGKSQIGRVMGAVVKAVGKTFDDDRQQSKIVLLTAQKPSEDEIKRRTNICYDLILRMRGDMNYSVSKVCALMYRALRTELDGTTWEPPPAERAYASG